jgi:hypothetical protein
MSDLYAHLAGTIARLTHRPLPAHWIAAEPILAGHRNHAGVLAAIADTRAGTGRSDEHIRALRRLATGDPAAGTVLLAALAPLLRTELRSPHTRTTGYLTDALTDLSLVTFEAPDIDTAPALARRLINRATTRTNKRYKREGRIRGGRRDLTDNLPSRSGPQPLHPPADPDFTTTVDDRVQIREFRTAVQRAITTGDLTPDTWHTFRDGPLRDALQPTSTTFTGVERNRTRRAAIRVRAAAHTDRLAKTA